MAQTKAIRTGDEYQEALKTIESLMTAAPDTPEGEKLDVLVALVEDYEAKQNGLTIEQARR